jgi:hypothetical protein
MVACLRLMVACSRPRSSKVMACLQSTATCSGSGSRMATVSLLSTTACFRPASRIAVHSGTRVEDSMLEDSRRRRWCPGCRDDGRWKLLEILLSVGREHVGPKIFTQIAILSHIEHISHYYPMKVIFSHK